MTGRRSIAIVGAGLAGSMLAKELGPVADVTLFERGRARPTRPPQIDNLGDPLGLFHSFYYGAGGTTNLWSGSLLPMLDGEFTPCWPEAVVTGLGRFHDDAVRNLYGRSALDAWRQLKRVRVAPDFHVDQILAMKRPARVGKLSMYRDAQLKFDSEVRSLKERGDGVMLRFVQGGAEKTRFFDEVIVSAGGLNSPLLLRRSGIGGRTVGDNLTDHPTGFVAKLRLPDWLRDTGLITDGPASKTAFKLRDPETGLWSMFVLCATDAGPIVSDPHFEFRKQVGLPPWRRSYGRFASKALGPEHRSRILKRLVGREPPGRHVYVLAFAEQEAHGQGSVREGPDGRMRLNWRVSADVVSAIDRSLDRLARGLAAELARAPGGTRGRLWSAAHHSGGCRIAVDPPGGVVDANLRVHGTNRIYVCDASVLPSTGASNTGLTIAALALRLAAHLAGPVPHVIAMRERELASA